MPQQTATDIVLGILKCYRAADHCFVNALLIDDKAKRIEAGLKCMTDRDICLAKVATTKIARSTEDQRDIARLKAALRHVR
jgi:hypothetical protein